MDWECSGCGRHFNWTVSECPYCKHVATITTGGTQPTDTQHTKFSIFELYDEYVSTVKITDPEFNGVRDFVRWLKNKKHL